MTVVEPISAKMLTFPIMPKILNLQAGNRIRELRQARGQTLRQLADAIGTTTSQLQRLEVGERELTLHWMSRVSRGLDCMPADLLLPVDGGLSDQEREWIETGRTVPDGNRAAINAFMEHQRPFRHNGADVTDIDSIIREKRA